MLQKSIKIENGESVVTYPYIKDPASLPYNKHQVIKMASMLEARLDKEGMLSAYNEEFKKYIDRGAFVKIQMMKSGTTRV